MTIVGYSFAVAVLVCSMRDPMMKLSAGIRQVHFAKSTVYKHYVRLIYVQTKCWIKCCHDTVKELSKANMFMFVYLHLNENTTFYIEISKVKSAICFCYQWDLVVMICITMSRCPCKQDSVGVQGIWVVPQDSDGVFCAKNCSIFSYSRCFDWQTDEGFWCWRINLFSLHKYWCIHCARFVSKRAHNVGLLSWKRHEARHSHFLVYDIDAWLQ